MTGTGEIEAPSHPNGLNEKTGTIVGAVCGIIFGLMLIAALVGATLPVPPS